MPGLLAAAIPAAASIAGSLVGFGGQQTANMANAKQAQLNRDFQERMSSTAVQRHVEDLKKAGLNPALAYQGQSSTPGGATATMQNAPAAGISAGHSASAVATNIQAMQAGIRKTNEETETIAFQRQLHQRLAEFDIAMRMNESEMKAAEAQVMKDPLWTARRVAQLNADLDVSETHARLNRSHARATEFTLPGLRNQAGAANTMWGRHITPYLNDAKAVIGIGASIGAGAAVGRYGGMAANAIKAIGGKPASAKGVARASQEDAAWLAEQRSRMFPPFN